MLHHTAILTGSVSEPQQDVVERAHTNRGYKSYNGWHVAYHYMIDHDGDIKQLHDDCVRTGHTRNQEINLHSIAVVLEGNFSEEKLGAAQEHGLHTLIDTLQKKYPGAQVIGHRDASGTACPGNHISEDFIHSL